MAASSLAFALLLVGLVMLVPVWIIVFRWVSVKCGLGKGSVWRPVDVTQLQPQWKTRLHTASLTEFHQRPPVRIRIHSFLYLTTNWVGASRSGVGRCLRS